jgi:hypothetical protein
MAMRMFLTRMLVVAALCFGVPVPRTQADLWTYPAETVYVSPTSSILTLPTSYAVESAYYTPTSYVVPTVPTSYAVPTVYSSYSYVPTYYASTYTLSPTSYVLPTVYASRVYASRTLLGRILFPRRWAYYYPTVYTTSLSYPVVSTSYPVVASSVCCTPAPAPTYAAAPPTAPASAAPANGSSQRGNVIQSEAAEPGLRGNETPPSAASAVPGSAATPAPPPTPAPEPGNEPAPTAPGGAQPGGVTPQPGSQGALSGFEGAERIRSAQRPKATDLEVMQTTAARAVLEGKVVSAQDKEPQGGVRVFIIDRRQRYTDRVATSDEKGRFKLVNLPEGDWTVEVEMPSRRRYPVSEITFASGKITDSYGRDVPGLIIMR